MPPTTRGALVGIGMQRVPGRTKAGVGFLVALEIAGGKFTLRFGRSFVMQRMRLGLVFTLIGKAFITLAQPIVGDGRKVRCMVT